MTKIAMRRGWLSGRIMVDLNDVIAALRSTGHESLAKGFEKMRDDFEKAELGDV